MVGFRYDIGGDMLCQSHLGLMRRAAAGGQPDALRNSEHVGVDRHGRPVVGHGEYHIGSFASDTGKRQQIVDLVRNFSVDVFYELLGIAYVLTCLVVGVVELFYQLTHLVECCGRHVLRGGKCLE